MTVTGADVVKQAMTHLGAHEDPMGSNRGIFVGDCQRATGCPGTGWPWCAGFVCRVAHEVGLTLPHRSCNAHALADYYPDVPLEHAKPGDVFDWNIGDGHTSIMIEKGDGWVKTIDGNWADAVTIVTHPANEIRRIWRIPGVDNTPPPKPHHHKPRWIVTTTSASGHTKVLFVAGRKRRLTRWLLHHTIDVIAPNGITIHRGKA